MVLLLQLSYTTLLCYIALSCTVLHYIVLCYAILHCAVLHYTILCHTTLHYVTLHYAVLCYTRLHQTTQHYATLQCMTSMCGVAPGEGEPAEASLHLLARSAGSGHGGLLLPAAAGRGHGQVPQHLRLPHPHATG